MKFPDKLEINGDTYYVESWEESQDIRWSYAYGRGSNPVHATPCERRLKLTLIYIETPMPKNWPELVEYEDEP